MSQTTDYYLSWESGCPTGNVNVIKRFQPNPIPAFSPLEIAGCKIWFDGQNTSSLTIANTSNIIEWANLGTAGGSAVTDGLVPTPIVGGDINLNSSPLFNQGSDLVFNVSLPNQAKSAFFVFATSQDLSGHPIKLLNAQPDSGFDSLISWDSVTGKTVYQFGNLASGYTGRDDAYLRSGAYVVATQQSDEPRIPPNISVQGLGLFDISGGIASGYVSDVQTYLLSDQGLNTDLAIGEIIVYSRYLTQGQYNDVISYLQVKWGFNQRP